MKDLKLIIEADKILKGLELLDNKEEYLKAHIQRIKELTSLLEK